MKKNEMTSVLKNVFFLEFPVHILIFFVEFKENRIKINVLNGTKSYIRNIYYAICLFVEIYVVVFFLDKKKIFPKNPRTVSGIWIIVQHFFVVEKRQQDNRLEILKFYCFGISESSCIITSKHPCKLYPVNWIQVLLLH